MKVFLLSLSTFCVLSSAPAALDFTLQHKTLPADGIVQDEVYITDGPSKIFMRVPPEWQVFNNAQALDFTSKVTGAQVRLERFPGTKEFSVDQGGLQALLQQATTQVPRDATKIVALPGEVNPLPIFAWKTLEVTFRYEYFGQTLRRSVMHLNMLPGRVVQLTVIAPDADFDKLHKQARQLMSSWFEPSRDLPPDLQRKYESPDPGNAGI